MAPGDEHEDLGGAVAVIGMAGRFPGADDVDALWANVVNGVESITFFPEHEREAHAALPEAPGAAPVAPVVCAGGLLNGIEDFDAAYFEIPPREAQLIDPQHRLFLECAVSALEHAGCDPARTAGAIGVFGGCGPGAYLLQVVSRPDLVAAVGLRALTLANDKDYLTTRVSYKLDLRGPSVLVQSACSTSLVAVHAACQSLLGFETDVALAGGVSVAVPQKGGHVHVPGGIMSPDGRCRPFDARAAGTVAGSGVGLVVLKRLADALEGGDCIHAVIRGSAVNNDGRKASFSAPGVSGQAAVITEAHRVAGVDPGSIGYVEAHGTGTLLGDPVEIQALTTAFRRRTDAVGSCALGALKANIGHLDAAAGVAGLIKAIHVVREGVVPPCVHFEAPNPHIDFGSTPFFVPTSAGPWPAGKPARRAGVSSFGIGGTNAHVVLEEPPAAPAAAPWRRPACVLTVSARSDRALDAACGALAAHLDARPSLDLGDAAFTLQVGRREHAHRRAVVAASLDEAREALRAPRKGAPAAAGRGAVFLFPGQSAQRLGAGAGLYAAEPEFRRAFDACAQVAGDVAGMDLARVAFEAGDGDGARLTATERVQPVLFAVEYALARLWMSWGVEPAAMLGHSLGEWVAACLAGVVTLEDAVAIVIERGRLTQAMPPGSMLAVGAPAERLEAFLRDGVEIAAWNAPGLVALSGPSGAIDRVKAALEAQGTFARRLETSHAFHSALLDGAVEPFRARVRRAALRPPRVPFLSNVTGAPITDEQAVDPDYWARHLRAPVRFAQGLEALRAEGHAVFLEVGPGRSLTALARRTLPSALGIEGLRSEREAGSSEQRQALEALGRLWEAGCPVAWQRLHEGEGRRRVPLPSYPFERTRHWVSLARAPRPGPEAAVSVDGARREGGAGAPAAAPAEGAAGRGARAEGRAGRVAPRTDMERLLARVWTEILGVEDIGVTDDFFALHGDSLMATQLVSRVRARLGVDVPVRALFEGPTIEAFAAEIERRQGAGAARSALPPIVPVPRRGRLPVSSAQQRLWFLDQLEPGSPAYNVSFAVRADGRLDLAALRRSLEEICRRHEALRTTFAAVEGRPVPVVAPAPSVPWRVSDLAHLSGADLEAETRRAIAAEALEVFDLASGPLLRAHVIRRAEREHIVVLVVHHIVFDVWSVGVFVAEFGALYRAFTRGLASPLPELPVQYVDFAAAQGAWLAGEGLEAELGYWRRKLAGDLPRVRVPADHAPEGARTWRGARQSLPAPAALADGARGLARREGVSPFMIFLACYKALLHQRTGIEDMVVGTDVANRNRLETEGMIGFFVNQLVIRADFSGNPAFTELVRRVRDVTLEAFEHQDLPFDRLVEALRPRRVAGQAPLFDAKFVMRNVRVPSIELDGVVLEALEVEAEAAPFDFVLTVAEGPSGFVFGVEYSTEFYRQETVRDFLEDYARALERATSRPEATLAELREHIEAGVEERRARELERARGEELARLGSARRRAVRPSTQGAEGQALGREEP
ncbi:type I polyketide synthase [Sorangium sp. So ce385]|uniref:type I polyketide synthase n=1 Tax=Sorangium sp. So ce385 TaxID=3133308 RepID=UPI003F5B671C